MKKVRVVEQGEAEDEVQKPEVPLEDCQEPEGAQIEELPESGTNTGAKNRIG